jgi:hypothetical protein
LQKKEATGELKGIHNGRKGPPISHLLFADDSVFFTGGMKEVLMLSTQHYTPIAMDLGRK